MNKVFRFVLLVSFNFLFFNCITSKQIDIGVYGVLYDNDYKMGNVIVNPQNPLYYSTYNLFDKNKYTALAMNAKYNNSDGNIPQDYFFIFLKNIITMDKLSLLNGYQKNEKLFFENSRIQDVEIEIYYEEDIVYTTNIILKDITNIQNIIFGKKIKCNNIFFTINSTYTGTKYNDVCISEMELWNGNEKYEIANLEQAKKEYLKKLKDTYKKYIAHINFKDVETVGFLEDKDLIFSKWKKCGIKTDKIVDLGTIFNNPGLNTYLSFNVDSDYSGKINIKLYGGKIMQIGNWKIDEKGAIWIKIGKGEWKVAENVHLAGTDLGTIKQFTEP